MNSNTIQDQLRTALLADKRSIAAIARQAGLEAKHLLEFAHTPRQFLRLETTVIPLAAALGLRVLLVPR